MCPGLQSSSDDEKCAADHNEYTAAELLTNKAANDAPSETTDVVDCHDCALDISIAWIDVVGFEETWQCDQASENALIVS